MRLYSVKSGTNIIRVKSKEVSTTGNILGNPPMPYHITANLLNTTGDFSVEVRLKSFMSGSEYGLVWGGSSPQNAHYFLLKGRKYSICSLVNGQVNCAVNQKAGKVKMDNNLLLVERSGNLVRYYINDNVVYEEPFRRCYGQGIWYKRFGVLERYKLMNSY